MTSAFSTALVEVIRVLELATYFGKDKLNLRTKLGEQKKSMLLGVKRYEKHATRTFCLCTSGASNKATTFRTLPKLAKEHVYLQVFISIIYNYIIHISTSKDNPFFFCILSFSYIIAPLRHIGIKSEPYVR